MNAHKGFTLIELLIVVVIVAILGAIAMPSYEAYTIRTRRATAAACLLELAQFMERFYTVNLQYHEDTAGAGVALPTPQCRSDLDGVYTFGFDGAVTQRAYAIQAAPQGRQANDACATLKIDQSGKKELADAAAGTDVAQCWK
ncbi:MAG: type IV pilin protein [Azoarcus sp.]|nr:type IV pilin protein [Azoarcus sp.]